MHLKVYFLDLEISDPGIFIVSSLSPVKQLGLNPFFVVCSDTFLLNSEIANIIKLMAWKTPRKNVCASV